MSLALLCQNLRSNLKTWACRRIQRSEINWDATKSIKQYWQFVFSGTTQFADSTSKTLDPTSWMHAWFPVGVLAGISLRSRRSWARFSLAVVLTFPAWRRRLGCAERRGMGWDGMGGRLGRLRAIRQSWLATRTVEHVRVRAVCF
jgi:hypothetical protein